MQPMENKAPHTLPGYVIYGSFALGLLTAVAFRAIIVLERVEPAWVRPVWYLAVVGNFFFFAYRYVIARKRRKAVEAYRLIEKLRSNACLEEGDREAMIFLLSSIKLSKENLNYIVISVFSIIAVAADLALAYFS
jgi:hypothetical protein